MVRFRASLALISVVFAFASSGCGGKGAVSLLARVENPELTVERAALGTTLRGSFELFLELGEYADDEVEVTLGSFGLVSGDAEVVPTLELSVASGPELPLTLGPGKAARITLEHDGTETYDAAVADALCSSGAIYRGGVSEDGAAKRLESASFAPACSP